MGKTAIVVPVYKKTLSWSEEISWSRCKEVFQDKDIILVYPLGMDISAYQQGNKIAKSIGLPPAYFLSVYDYSRLMCLPLFYEKFLEYKYMLIYQLDTFVFENNLDEWCAKGYDYVGAPWIEAAWLEKIKAKMPMAGKIIHPVGNGGLSLRKVRKFYYSSIFLYPITVLLWKKKWHEDLFWSSVGIRLIPFFKIPNVKEALKFSFEEHPEKCFQLNNNQLPFGCHAWEKFNPEFWEPHFKNYGYTFPKP